MTIKTALPTKDNAVFIVIIIEILLKPNCLSGKWIVRLYFIHNPIFLEVQFGFVALITTD